MAGEFSLIEGRHSHVETDASQGMGMVTGSEV